MGVFGIFFLSGATVALWSAALPAINHRLDLGEARIGAVLLATGVGAFTCMPVAGRLCDRWSSRRITMLAAPAAGLGLIGPALAPSYAALLATTFVFGAGVGVLDVSMNAHAVEVEQRYPRPILSAFHGVWSLGGVTGGVAIAGGLQLNLAVSGVMVAGALACAVICWMPGRMLLAGTQHSVRSEGLTDGQEPTGQVPPRFVIVLGTVALAAFISEGAAMDWAALHAYRVLGADLPTASLAFTVFTVAMTTMRLVGDRVRARFGPVWTIQKAVMTASVGFLVVVLAPALPGMALPCGLLGWFLVGLGLALVVPVIFATAGSGHAASGRALARVTTFGHVGMLAGPSVIGPLAEATSLGMAMAVPAALTLGIVALGPFAVRKVTQHAQAGVGRPLAHAPYIAQNGGCVSSTVEGGGSGSG